ncbi:MAG: carbon starvation protein A [Elusimicrobiota bacterium]|jgi:carbon starvation protein CstA|nr:carbon starvation protein A [Elusimicrobiota bacterium]
MISFFVALLILVVGYFVYGKVVVKSFGPDDRQTPALTKTDGVDFVPMRTWRVFLVQLLNIAGLGPIFGAVAGAMWGPQVFLWIALGSVFAGGVHDYLSGMISERNEGKSIAEISGIYLGGGMKIVMRIFSFILLIFVGTVFWTGPAGLLAKITNFNPVISGFGFWVIVIFIYYFIATIFPVDKIIGRIYPIFGAVLIIMAVGILGGIFFGGYYSKMPEISFTNVHPSQMAIWPFMFITVACGAISGFHSTQSPIMSRCIVSERDGRRVFYGAMIAEGVIALIWAAAGCVFYEATGGLAALGAALKTAGQGGVVYDISIGMLGVSGGILAMLGVIACPITSGDTAFRSARLTICDWFKIDQGKLTQRLLLAIPILMIGAILSQFDYQIIWRYFAWSNQTLATIVLWAGSVYLFKHSKSKLYAIMPAVPATFMTAVTVTYIFIAPEGFTLSPAIGYPVGIIAAAVCLFLFITLIVMKAKKS